MSELPEGWVVAPLHLLVRTKSGNSKLIKGRLSSSPEPGLVPAYSASGQDIWCDVAEWYGEGIVLSAVGARCGKAFFASGSWTAIANTHVIIPHDEIEPKFLWYRFNNERFWVKSGSAQPFVKVRASLEKTLLLPPLAEQRRIVAAIEEHFSRLAAAEESLRRANRRLGLFRRLVLRSTIEADYPTTTLADVAKVVSGQTPKGLVPLVEGPIPFFKVGDMNAAAGYEMAEARAYLDAELVETHRLRVRPAGTVIFPKRGGAIATNKKRILREPAAFDLNTMGLVPSERLLPEFLLYWLETKELSSLADGSNVPQINLPDIAPLQIPVPPLADQRRIVAEVERQLSLVDALAAATAAALKRSAALRRSILERAFTGKLVPQDPRDEPASVLLERIRAERAASERHQRPSTGRSRT